MSDICLESFDSINEAEEKKLNVIEKIKGVISKMIKAIEDLIVKLMDKAYAKKMDYILANAKKYKSADINWSAIKIRNMPRFVTIDEVEDLKKKYSWFKDIEGWRNAPDGELVRVARCFDTLLHDGKNKDIDIDVFEDLTSLDKYNASHKVLSELRETKKCAESILKLATKENNDHYIAIAKYTIALSQSAINECKAHMIYVRVLFSLQDEVEKASKKNSEGGEKSDEK